VLSARHAGNEGTVFTGVVRRPGEFDANTAPASVEQRAVPPVAQSLTGLDGADDLPERAPTMALPIVTLIQT